MKPKITADNISNFPINKIKKYNNFLDAKLGESPFFLSVDTVLNLVSPSSKNQDFYNKHLLGLLISNGISISQIRDSLEKIHDFSFVEKIGFKNPIFTTPTLPTINKTFDKRSQFQEKSNKALLISLTIYLEITKSEINYQRNIYANCTQDSISAMQTIMQISIAFIHLFLDDLKYFMDFSGKKYPKSDMQTSFDKLFNDPYLKDKILGSLELLQELNSTTDDPLISEAANMILKFIKPEILIQYFKDLD